MPISRRAVLNSLAVSGAMPLLNRPLAATNAALFIAGKPVELTVTPVGDRIIRISLVPIEAGKPQAIPSTGALVEIPAEPPVLRVTELPEPRVVACADAGVSLFPGPLVIRVARANGRIVQDLQFDEATGGFSFRLGSGPVLGLGEGGRQFDRRGAVDRMRSGQGGYSLRTHGGRVPVPWLIGTSGWAMLVHQPGGTFDLTADPGKFAPTRPAAALPLDIFVVTAREPERILAEYARLTGHPEMPPLWSLGYQQSHRTLASRETVMSVARTFREKKLPCDVLIYLGTGFCPSGWNKGHGSFEFNPRAFPDPKPMLDELHKQHYHVVPHVVIHARSVSGRASDPFDKDRTDESKAGSYWNAHRGVFSKGVDGWWPDEGDPLDGPSRLARIRMYYEGCQIDRPDRRPYALHRNGYAGMQRYAAFLWSGDVYSTWPTLRTHVSVAINTGLTGIPYWGTDIGGFVPTPQLTGELYVRWFQFGAFCPLFRSHGRTWMLRLPWGWNTGELGPDEIRTYGDAANPLPSELHNAQVEPICRKYLELRYRLMPYLYSVVCEGTKTGLPVMRALWIHHSDDTKAVARGDEYLFGPNILVAPIFDQRFVARDIYLPRGVWYHFWSGQPVQGGREFKAQYADISKMPLYIRAGTILPLGPVKQYTGEVVDGPLTLQIYPGADGQFMVYEDDGISFAYRTGDWMGLDLRWDDKAKRLSIALAPGSRMRPPMERPLELRLIPEGKSRLVVFKGERLEVTL
jgi:alpha-glucosidase (family GH31 glycosyl hydrolase)